MLFETKKVCILGSLPSSLYNFRGDMIRSLVKANVEVIAMASTPTHEEREEVLRLGASYLPFHIKRNNLNPLDDLRTFADLRKALNSQKPSHILAYTIKPVIWGGIAAKSLKTTRFYPLITGLGYAFEGKTLRRRILSNVVINLYKIALSRSEDVIFQNEDNRNLFVAKKIVPYSKTHVVAGSGVNLQEFTLAEFPTGAIRFLLIARLLGEKGIREYVNAARKVKKAHPAIQFDLVGPTDPSPDGIPIGEVRSWQEEGVINYHGAQKDVRQFIKTCHVYCLPSYHEGMPRTVLESMAMGRPILTTYATGCKDTVEQGRNGWLVPIANELELEKRMNWFIKNTDQINSMGNASRDIAEKKFDVNQVNKKILEITKLTNHNN